MTAQAWRDERDKRAAMAWREVRRVKPVNPLHTTLIYRLMSAERLTYDEAKARVCG